MPAFKPIFPLAVSSEAPWQNVLHAPRRRVCLLFTVSTLAFLGLFSVLFSTSSDNPVPMRPRWRDNIKYIYEKCDDVSDDPQPTQASQTVWPDVEHVPLTLNQIRSIVSGTKGFYVRDYSVGLGWNNMRYIIETSLLHARLLNRTLVIPSFVYARACEFPDAVCSAHAELTKKPHPKGLPETRPKAREDGWRIPMETMIDLPHLRKTENVILVSEYLRLHNLSTSAEVWDGQWDREGYHNSTRRPTLRVIPNSDYDLLPTVRVDKLINKKKIIDMSTNPVAHALNQTMLRKKKKMSTLDWDEARTILENGSWDVSTDQKLRALVESSGFEVVHTFQGPGGVDFQKSVTEPMKRIAPRMHMRGIVDDWGHYDEEVLLLEGEIHAYRKPGATHFTTEEARDTFATTVLYGMRPIAKVDELAERLSDRMWEKSGGRMWVAAHMRRGDFAKLNWAMEPTFHEHFERILDRLKKGRALLRTITNPIPPNIPDGKVDTFLWVVHRPIEYDPFYLATDERDPENVKYLKTHGAVLIRDLLTPEDHRFFGWQLLFTDVLSLVEQALMSRAAFFYGHEMSSVAGGVVNLRAVQGADPRTTLID